MKKSISGGYSKKGLDLICVPHILRAMACAVKNKNHNTQTSVLMG